MVSARGGSSADVCGDTGWFNGLTAEAEVSITVGDADLNGNVWLGGSAANAQIFALPAITRTRAAVFLHSNFAVSSGMFTTYVVDKIDHPLGEQINVNGV